MSCATTALPLGALGLPGSIQNTAPLSESNSRSGQAVKLRPIAATSPLALPSVTPTVSHESHCASGWYGQNSGFVPPTSLPNGAQSHFHVCGMIIGESASP